MYAVALQQIYKANQRDGEHSRTNYCWLKALARVAFHAQNDQVRAQQVAARMQQGLCRGTTCVNKATVSVRGRVENSGTAEVAELDLATSITPALAIQADIKALISTTQDTGIDNPGTTTLTERQGSARETTGSILLCIASTTTGRVAESDVMTVNILRY